MVYLWRTRDWAGSIRRASAGDYFFITYSNRTPIYFVRLDDPRTGSHADSPYTSLNAFLRPDVYQPLWFLHRALFFSSLELPEDDPGRAHPGLVAAVAAYGAASSSAHDVLPDFINSALNYLNINLGAGTPAYNTLALHSIQARVIIGNLLLSRGELLQGADVLTGACTLARNLLLHVPPHQHSGFLEGIVEAPLPPPDGAVAAAERAGAAWVVATLERLWAMAR